MDVKGKPCLKAKYQLFPNERLPIILVAVPAKTHYDKKNYETFTN